MWANGSPIGDPNQKDNLKNPSVIPTSLIRMGLLSYPTKRLKVHSLQEVYMFLDCRGPGILKRKEIHESLEKHIESPQPSCSAPREKLEMGHSVVRSKNAGQPHTSNCPSAKCAGSDLHHGLLFAIMETLCSQDSLMALFPPFPKEQLRQNDLGSTALNLSGKETSFQYCSFSSKSKIDIST